MIRELIYLFILFIAGYLVLSAFFNFYSSAGKIIANQISNITTPIYNGQVNYVVNYYNSGNNSILYLVQNMNPSCISNVEIGNKIVNFTYKVLNQYTIELNVSYPVNAGDNLTVTFCNGQSSLYYIGP
jgi:predicted ATP-grasp superfamily ATP-dependent carboligase